MELSSISGDYVSVLLPLVTQQFKVENDKSRYEVVHCLSEVFSNPAIDYMKQYRLSLCMIIEMRDVLRSIAHAFKIDPQIFVY